MGDRVSTLTRFGLAWLVMYLVVGTELSVAAPHSGVSLLTEWSALWMALGVVLAPVCFFLGGRFGTRQREMIAVLVALLSVCLAVVAIHVTVLRAGTGGMSSAAMPLSLSLLAAAALIYGLVRTLEAGVGCTTLAVFGGLLVFVSMLIVPNLIHCRCGSLSTACKSNLKNIGTALEMYSTDNEGHFPVDIGQLTPNYLKAIPTCPSAGVETYSLSYEQETRPQDAYTIFCMGLNHADTGYGLDTPLYSSRDGIVDRRTDAFTHGRPAVPLGRTVRLDQTFLVAQIFTFLLGLLAASDPRIRAVGIGMMAFALIPWSYVVNQDAKPIQDRNACVRNLVAVRRGVELWRRSHPTGTPTYEDIRPYLRVPQPMLCPAAHNGYLDGFQVGRDGTVTVACKGAHHANAGCAADHPRYVEAEQRIDLSP